MAQTLRHIKNSIAGALLLGGFYVGIQGLWQFFSPDHFWVEYRAIEFVAQTEDGLTWQSSSAFPRGGSALWNDVLRCDTTGDRSFTFFSFYDSRAGLDSDSDFGFNNSAWLYPSPIPQNGECYIDSHSEIRTSLGFIKTEDINSEIITIKDGVVQIE